MRVFELRVSILRRSNSKGVGKRLFKAWLGRVVNSYEIDHAIFYGIDLKPSKGGASIMTAPKNDGKAWSPQNKTLQSLAKGNTPTRVIGLKLGRSPAAVQNQASKLGISLKPTNQSPYGTKKK